MAGFVGGCKGAGDWRIESRAGARGTKFERNEFKRKRLLRGILEPIVEGYAMAKNQSVLSSQTLKE